MALATSGINETAAAGSGSGITLSGNLWPTRFVYVASGEKIAGVLQHRMPAGNWLGLTDLAADGRQALLITAMKESEVPAELIGLHLNNPNQRIFAVEPEKAAA